MSWKPSTISRTLGALPAPTALGVVTVSALALLAASFWVFELFTHFRLQVLAVQIPLLLVCLWLRRWILVALIAPFTIVNAAIVAPYWPRENAVVSAPVAVEVMTVNLYGRNDEHARFIEFVDEEIEARQYAIAAERGYEIIDHSLVLYVRKKG